MRGSFIYFIPQDIIEVFSHQREIFAFQEIFSEQGSLSPDESISSCNSLMWSWLHTTDWMHVIRPTILMHSPMAQNLFKCTDFWCGPVFFPSERQDFWQSEPNSTPEVFCFAGWRSDLWRFIIQPSFYRVDLKMLKKMGFDPATSKTSSRYEKYISIFYKTPLYLSRRSQMEGTGIERVLLCWPSYFNMDLSDLLSKSTNPWELERL